MTINMFIYHHLIWNIFMAFTWLYSLAELVMSLLQQIITFFLSFIV